jgi:hypothetical protein
MWPPKPKADPAEVVRSLREQALRIAPAEINEWAGAGQTQVWGALMEIGYPEAAATLVTFIGGTTSLYFSNGGGIIGAGERAGVKETAKQFLALADTLVDNFTLTDEYPLPQAGRVRFYVRTFDGVKTAEADEQDIGQQKDPLSELYYAGHRVIAAIRESGAFQ